MSFLFIFLLVVLGGVIAYFADRLGRTLGKKRLSLFGLRPRHTAEVLTVGAGMLIPIVTFAVVMIASADVREWLLHSPEYRAERDDAIKKATQARNELYAIQANLADQKKLLDQAKKDLDATTASLKELRLREADLVSQVKSQSAKAGAAQNQYRMAFAQYKKVNGELVYVKKDYLSVQQSLKGAQRQYASLNKTYSDLQARNSQLVDSFKNLQKQEQEAYTEVTKDRKELEKLSAQLASEQGQLDQTQKEYQAVQKDLGNAKSELAQTQAALNQVQGKLAVSDYVGERSRLLPIMYERGDEVARIEVPAGLTENQAKLAVQELIRRASAASAEKGAMPNNTKLAAGLVSYSEDLTAEKQLDAVVKALSGAQEPSALVASAFYNTFSREFVPVVINVYNNPLVYKKNQPVAETLVQGALPDVQIYQQISEFLQTKVRPRAKEAKMIPIAGKEESLGQVQAGDIFTLMKQIRSYGRQVRLIALARQDTHAADPLDLNFKLAL